MRPCFHYNDVIMFLFLFAAVPIIEIYLFIVIGGQIGALPTIALIIITALIGLNMLRVQGLDTMSRYRQTAMQGEIPAFEMIEGVFLLVGGVMLLTPGFFTDALGFLCLVKTSRLWIIRHLAHRFEAGPDGFTFYARRSERRQTQRRKPWIEGEYRKEEDEDSRKS